MQENIEKYQQALAGIGMLMAIAAGCSAETKSAATEENRATIVEDDGTISFWRGKNIAARLARAEQIGGEADRNDSMRFRAAQALLDRAAAAKERVVTISMEQPSTDLIEISLRTNSTRGNGSWETVVLRPGDPWVTGHVQVQETSDGTFRGFFSVKRYVKSSIGSLAEQIWETGMNSDPNMPALKFGTYPWKEPLPATWR